MAPQGPSSKSSIAPSAMRPPSVSFPKCGEAIRAVSEKLAEIPGFAASGWSIHHKGVS